MGRENRMRAIAPKRLSFGAFEERSTEPAASVLLGYPEMRDYAGAAPGMTAETSDELASIGTNASAKELSIGVASCFGVELVDAIHEHRFQLLTVILVQQRY